MCHIRIFFANVGFFEERRDAEVTNRELDVVVNPVACFAPFRKPESIWSRVLHHSEKRKASDSKFCIIPKTGKLSIDNKWLLPKTDKFKF
jgi:hypothetical protein